MLQANVSQLFHRPSYLCSATVPGSSCQPLPASLINPCVIAIMPLQPSGMLSGIVLCSCGASQSQMRMRWGQWLWCDREPKWWLAVRTESSAFSAGATSMTAVTASLVSTSTCIDTSRLRRCSSSWQVSSAASPQALQAGRQVMSWSTIPQIRPSAYRPRMVLQEYHLSRHSQLLPNLNACIVHGKVKLCWLPVKVMPCLDSRTASRLASCLSPFVICC